MYNVIYKDLITEEIHGAIMTSRQLWMFRLNSSIEVVKAEKGATWPFLKKALEEDRRIKKKR